MCRSSKQCCGAESGPRSAHRGRDQHVVNHKSLLAGRDTESLAKVHRQAHDRVPECNDMALPCDLSQASVASDTYAVESPIARVEGTTILVGVRISPEVHTRGGGEYQKLLRFHSIISTGHPCASDLPPTLIVKRVPKGECATSSASRTYRCFHRHLGLVGDYYWHMTCHAVIVVLHSHGQLGRFGTTKNF
jgi:hypothetical protein